MSVRMHTRKILSHSSKKNRTLRPVMMDDSVRIHKRRELVKTYKTCSSKIVVAKVCRETYSPRSSRKIKRNAERESLHPT